MLKIIESSRERIVLEHLDEREDSPGRYTGLATSQIVNHIASALCGVTEGSGVALKTSTQRQDMIQKLVESGEWEGFAPGCVPFASSYALFEDRFLFLPGCKEDLDFLIAIAFPDLEAKLAIFSEYKQIFAPSVGSFEAERHINDNELFLLTAYVNIFVVAGRYSDPHFHELVDRIVDEINQYLN